MADVSFATQATFLVALEALQVGPGRVVGQVGVSEQLVGRHPGLQGGRDRERDRTTHAVKGVGRYLI